MAKKPKDENDPTGLVEFARRLDEGEAAVVPTSEVTPVQEGDVAPEAPSEVSDVTPPAST